MLHLLNIEFLKLQRNRSFLILSLLFAASILGINYIILEIIKSAPVTNDKITFSDVWAVVPYITSFLLVIPGFIIIMHTCSEYTYRTHRQNVIDGLSRNQYITTKILFIIVLALFSTIATIITAFVAGISLGADISFDSFRYIYYFFIQATAYISLAFLFALLFKKTGLTTGLFFVYSLIIENILERYINKINIGTDKIGEFLPLASSEHLLMPESVQTVLSFAKMGNAHSEYAYLIASIVYIILCYLACYYRYEKQDL
jgi:ABC-type transport system involved in multi-copper enzyme maturation permease subunit